MIRTFGRESGKAGPGLHFSFPIVQRRDVVNVEQVRRVEVGFRGQQRVPDEALMLTGDENIVRTASRGEATIGSKGPQNGTAMSAGTLVRA